MRTCAFFDLDGTIIDNSSEKTFVRYLMSKGKVSLTNLASWGVYLLKKRKLAVAKANKVYLRNINYEYIKSAARKCFRERLEHHISPKAIARIQFHKKQGDSLILLSGSLEILVVNFKEHLEMDMMVGYSLEVKDGVVTGRTLGIHPYERNKAILAQQMAEEYDFDLDSSYAYGNHHTDAHILSLVGNPVAVNPDRKLRKIAQKNGWKIEMFAEY